MRRAPLVLLALALLLWPRSVALAQANDCSFVLGFATLHDLIPSIVGGCSEGEGHNPANGDGLQHTSGGLLVWRKFDNWTAFTDGSHTWINGPNGLQERRNTERFPWEVRPSLGPEEPVFPASGANLREFPDTHMSFLRTAGGVEVYFVAGTQTYRVVVPSLDDLATALGGAQPIQVPNRGGFPWAADYFGAGEVVALPGAAPQQRLGLFHAEEHCSPGDSSHLVATVGLASSDDSGQTWTIVGSLPTGQPAVDPCAGFSGAGQPSALIRNGYIYVYLTQWIPGRDDAIYVARAPAASAADPGAYQIYDGQAWVPAGQGTGAPVIRRPDASFLYAANPSVSFNTALNSYLAVFETNKGFCYTTSQDGVSWAPPTLLLPFAPPQFPIQAGATWLSYPSLLDPAAPSDEVTGLTGNLYYAKGVRDGQPHQLYRRPFALTPDAAMNTPPPAQAVAPPPRAVALVESHGIPQGGDFPAQDNTLIEGDLTLPGIAGADRLVGDGMTGRLIVVRAGGQTVRADYAGTQYRFDGPIPDGIVDVHVQQMIASGCGGGCSGGVQVIELNGQQCARVALIRPGQVFRSTNGC